MLKFADENVDSASLGGGREGKSKENNDSITSRRKSCRDIKYQRNRLRIRCMLSWENG